MDGDFGFDLACHLLEGDDFENCCYNRTMSEMCISPN